MLFENLTTTTTTSSPQQEKKQYMAFVEFLCLIETTGKLSLTKSKRIKLMNSQLQPGRYKQTQAADALKNNSKKGYR